MTALAPLSIESVRKMNREDLFEIADEYGFGNRVNSKMTTDQVREIVIHQTQAAKEAAYSRVWRGED